jgi:transposase-like protein
MGTTKIEENKICPKCGKTEGQNNFGFNRSGTQRCRCRECSCTYTLEPKRRAYPEEVRELAIKEFYVGVSGRSVGKIHGMSGNNVYNWIKKPKRCE